MTQNNGFLLGVFLYFVKVLPFKNRQEQDYHEWQKISFQTDKPLTIYTIMTNYVI